MRRTQWARPEKRLLWLSSILCGVPLGLSGLYEWNNRVPNVQLLPRVIPKLNAEEWFVKAATLYVPPIRNITIPGGGMDLPFEEVPAKVVPLPYASDYNRIYPLARKNAFLRANSASLAALRRGLQLPYANTHSGYTTGAAYWGRLRKLTRLLLVEAHARAQRGDWNGAADSLLDAHHLGCLMPNEAPVIATAVGYSFRTVARRDLWALAPHLSAQKLRDVARKIEVARASGPSLSQCLSWEKRSRQEALLRFTKRRDFRPFYLPINEDCMPPATAACAVSQAEIQRKLEQLNPFLQTYLAWMSKPRLMTQLTRHMDWEIAQSQKNYPQRAQKWPDSNWNDNLDLLIHESNERLSFIFARGEAQDALLSTLLAIRAFRLEKGRNPRALTELVPRYLSRVPLDPFSNRQTLRYKNQARKFVVGLTVNPKYAKSPFPPGAMPSNFWLRRYETVPFTLYSLGLNARDDGGTPYEDANQTERLRRYVVNPNQSPSAADIVAGINN